MSCTIGRWIGLFLWACAGCSQYHAAKVEHHFRYDPQTDTALCLEIGSGVQARKDSASSRGDARRALEAMTHRQMAVAPSLLWIPNLEVNLDLSLRDFVDGLAEIEASEEEALFAAVLTPDSEVLESGLFRHEGRLHYYRLVRVSRVNERLRAENRLWNLVILNFFEHADVEHEIDAPTWELWLEKARRGADWCIITDDEFVISAPMTPTSVLTTLDEMQRTGAHGLLLQLESTSFAAGHWIARFRLPIEQPLSIEVDVREWQSALEPSMPAEPRSIDSVRALIHR